MIYRVLVTETVSKIIEVEADDSEDACMKAADMHCNEEIDLLKDVDIESSYRSLGAIR